LLAPAAVRYLVVPNHNGPSGSGAVPVITPGSLLAGLQLQTDLQVVNADADYTVYQNAAWAPARAVLPAAAVTAAAATGPAAARQLQQTDLTGAAPLAGHSVPGASTVYVAGTRESGWRLRVGSTSLAAQPAFNWALRFTPPAAVSGPVRIEPPSAGGLHGVQVAEIFLWLAAIAVAGLDLRRRRLEHPPTETVHPEWFAPMAPAGSRPRWRPTATGALGAEDLKGDEVWVDV
jgi:hypothetical protein